MKELDLNGEMIAELRSAVISRMNTDGKKMAINRLVKEIISEVGLEPTSVLRRAHDGCSQVDWLIEKMIGEFLIDGQQGVRW
jgi:hypothetical protein